MAIFVGQVSAALAAGNPVLAKPAEQTPLIAAAAVRLFHRAGVPRAALQLLPGRGDVVGAALVADPRVAGVLFTGSTEVARLIARTLATRTDDPVLIAETGGDGRSAAWAARRLGGVGLRGEASGVEEAVLKPTDVGALGSK